MTDSRFMTPATAPKPRGLGTLAVACLILQFSGALLLSLMALALWLAALALADRPALMRLWMPRFWAVTLVFALASGWLLGERDMAVLGVSLSRVGLQAGMLMVVRGMFFFALANWASRALTGPTILTATRRIGLPELGRAIKVAFDLLPAMKDRFEAARVAGEDHHGSRPRSWQRFYDLAVEGVFQTALLAEEIAANEFGAEGKE